MHSMLSFFRSAQPQAQTSALTFNNNQSEDQESQDDVMDFENNTENDSSKSQGANADCLSNLNDRNKKGKTALHKAVAKDNIALVSALSKTQEVIVDAADDEGKTALYFAAQKKSVEYASILITAGASVNKQNNNGETPLHSAVLNHSVENVSLLLRNKADPAVTTYKINNPNYFGKAGLSSSLHYAFYDRKTLSLEMITLLLSATADLSMQNQEGKTPLYLASAHQSVNSLSEETIKQLLESTDLTVKSRKQKTVLHAAAENKAMSKETFAKILTKCVASEKSNNNNVSGMIDWADNRGNTALYYAVSNRSVDKALLLLKSQANPNIYQGYSPLHIATKNNDTELAMSLIVHGADVNAKDKDGNTPLVYAAKNGNLELIECLHKKRALFSGKEGDLAVKKALLNNHIDALIKLIEYGANPDMHVYPKSRDSWENSSAFASSSFPSPSSSSPDDGEEDKTNLLSPGDTPLHYAVKTANKDLATICLQKKPEMVNSINDKGKTPAHIAIKVLSPDMAHLLWTKGSKINPSQNCPGLVNKASSYWSKPRQNTLLMQAATRGFSSPEALTHFFEASDYKLSEEQLAIKKTVDVKYQPRSEDKNNRVNISLGHLSDQLEGGNTITLDEDHVETPHINSNSQLLKQ